MSVTLFVANFPFAVEEKDLAELFERHGEVCGVTIRRSVETGESKGWGFVTMIRPGEAQHAISALNGEWWRGRRLKVSEAQPRSYRERGW